MDAIGVFTPEQARELWQDYQSRKQLKPQLRQNYPERRPVDEVSPHRVFIKNTETEEIPAHGCVRVTGVELVNERTVIKVEKPSSTNGEFLFNGPYAIAAGELGWAYRHGVVNMLGDEPSEAGASYSPIIDSWEIEEGGDKFVVFGRHDVSDRALVGRFAGGGSGGGHTIWFTIDSVLCPETDYVAETTLVVTATWYNQGCTKTPPGANYEGTYDVYDLCNYLRGLTPTDLVGGTGRATYHYPLTGYCVPRWIIDDLCPQPECA